MENNNNTNAHPMSKWDTRFISLARLVATWSKDQETQVGAVIVDTQNTVRSMGFNGFPRGINDTDSSRMEKPVDNHYWEHAERNAIFHCAKSGVATQSCTLYCTHSPCSACARGIIQAGITRVVIDSASSNAAFHIKHADMCQLAIAMMREGGVVVDVV